MLVILLNVRLTIKKYCADFEELEEDILNYLD